MLAPDTVIAGKYIVKRPLESGGMGDVYDGWQIDLARAVALKTLHADLADDGRAFLRFRREAEASAALAHPNIVQLLDFQQDPDGIAVLVMEKLEGQSLRALLAAEGALPAPRAIFIALQILSALATAHRARIIHRDIKPANIFVLKTLAVRDFVKVLDFGIAKMLAGDRATLTNLGQVIGTLGYMAPEQARGQPVDGRTDLFAVGAILFEALSGKRPRELKNLIAAGREPCRKLLDVAPSIDPVLAAAIDRSLAFDPDDRFESAEAMGEALGSIITVESDDLPRLSSAPTARAPTPTEPIAPHTTPFLQESTVPMPNRPTAAPAVLERVPIAPPVRPRPRPSRALWLLLLLPAVPVVGIALLVAGMFAIGKSRHESEMLWIRSQAPATCDAPALCVGQVAVGADRVAVCSPTVATQYHVGDVVFYSHYGDVATVTAAAGSAWHITTWEDGTELVVRSNELYGRYCR